MHPPQPKQTQSTTMAKMIWHRKTTPTPSTTIKANQSKDKPGQLWLHPSHTAHQTEVEVITKAQSNILVDRDSHSFTQDIKRRAQRLQILLHGKGSLNKSQVVKVQKTPIA